MKKLYEEANIAAIASEIREKTGGAETYTTAEMPSGVESVYEAGKQSAYDAFWDVYQEDGNRSTYAGAFAGKGWNAETFKPKYPIALSGSAVANYMFFEFNKLSYDKQDNLFDFAPYNDKISFSGCTAMRETFRDARIKNLYCDCSNATELIYTFLGGNGGYLENLTVKLSEKTTNFSSTFGTQLYVKNLTVTDDSVIAANISFTQCNSLSAASIRSIVRALSSTASGKKLTLSKTAVNAAFTDEEWTALANTKSNWTISLA